MIHSIETYRKLLSNSKIVWRQHCLERMQERDISRTMVINVIQKGNVIEEYDNDFPYPSCLILGFWSQNLPLHVVCGCDGEVVYVITAYVPEKSKFGENFDNRL